MSKALSSFTQNFLDPYAVLHETSRLIKINDTVGKDAAARTELLAKISDCSKSLLALSKELGRRKISHSSFLKTIGELNRFYEVLHPKKMGANAISKIAQIMQRDVAALAFAPIKKPKFSLYGLTLLVNSPSSYVIKKTGYPEIIANKIYQVFASQVRGQKIFGAPTIATLDFEEQSYQKPQGDTVYLRKHKADAFSKAISSIGLYTTTQPLYCPSTVMLSEQIQGKNVLEFLTKTYRNLTPEQKGAFFFKVGAVSMLDLIIGNFDRFIGIDIEQPNFLSTTLSAHLGNALIVFDENVFDMVVIDNEIASIFMRHLAPKEEDMALNIRNRYYAFLQNVFSDPKGIDSLVKNIIESFKITKSKSGLEPFLNDLNVAAICEKNIKKGLLEMGSLLQQVIIPYWNSPNADTMKIEIEQRLPGALEHLTERLRVFYDARSLTTLRAGLSGRIP